MQTKPRLWLGGAGVALLVGATGAGPAQAAITPDRNATNIANAIVKDASTLRGASWVTIPAEVAESSDDNPAGIIDAPLAGFPQEAGADAALLSSGNVDLADDPNDDEGSGHDFNTSPNLVDSAGVNRGDTAYDVTILKLDLTAPANTNCLSFLFRFASEEYPEYVGTAYNDAFIAELDGTNWTTAGSEIAAPRNFAFDPAGKVISINATGGESVAPEDAAGTTYDAATQVLIASATVTPGDHSLYLSIFDQGDGILDATAFVDNLSFSQAAPGACAAGAVVNEFNPPVSTTATQIPPFTRNGVVEFVVTDGPRGSGPKAVHVKLNGGAEQVLPTSGIPGRASMTLTPGRHSIEYWGEDRRGNQEAQHHFADVVVDTVAPTLTLTNLQDTAAFHEGAEAFLKVVATDDLSGLQTDPSNPKLRLDTGTAGARTLPLVAIDKAGNQASATFAYTVTKVAPASVIVLQPAKKCVSRRRFGIRVKRKPGMKIKSTSVKVGSKKARTFTGGKAVAPINLRGIVGKRRVKVTVTVTTSTGKKFTLTRRYRTCAGR